jgi:molecular chaperone HtpG
MRRYREMSALSGGMNYYTEMPAAYSIIVNMQSPVIEKIWADKNNSGTLLKQVSDLALLENGMLKGKDLAEFIARSRELLK